MIHEFELNDHAGKSHRYSVAAHPGSEGFPVVSQIAAAVIDPLAGTALSVLLKVVPEALKRATGADGKINVRAVLDDPAIVEKLGDLDLGSTGPALQRAVGRFDLPLIRQILRHTSRDGKPLDKESAFDGAYAGNYWELLQAVQEVCSFNRFFPLPAGFGSLAALGADLMQRSGSRDEPPNGASTGG